MSLTAEDIMTRNVRIANPDDSVAKIARLLSDHDISALPVCDSQGVVIGVVSEGDLIEPEGFSGRAWWLSMLAEGENVGLSILDYIKVQDRRVVDFMVAPAITAAPETTIADLAKLLVQNRIKRLPIVRDKKLVGVVSRADLIWAFVRTPDFIAEAL